MLENKEKPIEDVQHRFLWPADHGTMLAWKRECPFCPDGVLMVARDPTTFELQEHDACFSCGQRVRWVDIAAMRKRDGSEATAMMKENG